uniref:Uncharacterized protein n=1 Tax=Sinocyclocheilus anshuiensis TaxID=1608454 RepID=A0A671K2H7_9TELE
MTETFKDSCALANLTFAKQGQKRICDTSLMISSDFSASLDTDAEGNGNIHNRSLSKQMIHSPISEFCGFCLREISFLFSLLSGQIFHHTEYHRSSLINSEYCTFPSGMDTRLNSLPIYQDILVLKQDKEDRKCFRATFERVIVVRITSSPRFTKRSSIKCIAVLL